MSFPHYLRLVVFGLAVGGCSPRNFDSAAEGQKLLRRDAEWADLATAGKDIEKIVSYWTDDAVLIFPGQPALEGKAAIRAYVAASLNTPGFKIHWVSQKPVFSSDGKFAYMRGTDELTLPGPNGTPMTLHLRGISLWRFDPDGQWRCVVDTSNEEPPPAPKSQHVTSSQWQRSSNQATELTASRRTIQLHMSSTLQSAATRAPARGSSSCSR